ncbi:MULTISPECIES: tRNA (adenosine(37)-N6)-threonylcarbamoyltransferase complex transferase subunit TsaD [unclassified Roseitalea]|uniref:tRNA (adenosine(37)-N6)-threonylcarbamoyltransferase complex transferase subunit TsaD n=1 Tax=unclassified Roseitalea TaxID=2639107 RepID=UPI00273D325A|nr:MULTISPECIES: tRNA (adenosine(37)-N6)-threonylcarbamoyltransferase complex transferase subunit TsaD [unclassified Roseitalea]
MTTVLGIETSCDETAAAVVRAAKNAPSGEILANVVYSQFAEHAAFGGVVPEIAARAHVEKLDGVIAGALERAETGWDRIDAVAATAGPGLIGGLIVGTMTAKAIAMARGKPFVAVNHLEGHALTPRLTDGLAFPYLLLLVSGGHTQMLLVRGLGDYERWATTIDDALGEAFDKTAKLLGLPYPGGPQVEARAARGDPARFDLPRPLRGEARPDFSFSGLKTALRQRAGELGTLGDTDIDDLCASFQAAVVDTLEDRVTRSLQRYRNEISAPNPTLVVAGGVAANGAIRSMLEALCRVHGFAFFAPPMALCADNAAMIAWAGLEHFRQGARTPLDAPPRPRWPLDEAAAPLIGAGRKGAKA